jgi:hypothetical protein
VSAGWLFGGHLLLSDFGPNRIFMNVCVGIRVAMVMLLRDFGPYDHSSMAYYTHVLLHNTA